MTTQRGDTGAADAACVGVNTINQLTVRAGSVAA